MSGHEFVQSNSCQAHAIFKSLAGAFLLHLRGNRPLAGYMHGYMHRKLVLHILKLLEPHFLGPSTPRALSRVPKRFRPGPVHAARSERGRTRAVRFTSRKMRPASSPAFLQDRWIPETKSNEVGKQKGRWLVWLNFYLKMQKGSLFLA